MSCIKCFTLVNLNIININAEMNSMCVKCLLCIINSVCERLERLLDVCNQSLCVRSQEKPDQW